MILRYNYRCYPTKEQEVFLAKTFGCVRFVYNNILAQRTAAYKDGVRMDFSSSSKALTTLKNQPEYLWLKDVSKSPLQQATRHLQLAFSSFFDKRGKYPTFKKKTNHDSASFCRFAFRFKGKVLHLAKMGALNVNFHRDLPSEPSTVTVTKNAAGQYHVSFVVEKEQPVFEKTGINIGIDFGLKSFATLSNGEEVKSFKPARDVHKRRILLARRLAKKVKGSKRRELARLALAKLELKVKNVRKDFQEKFSLDIVKRFDKICIEDLNLRGMVKNHNLARSITDASIGATILKLTEKAIRYGKEVVKIDRYYPSSQTCSCCGILNPKLRGIKALKIREFECGSCGNKESRDLNAAKNIMAVGQTVSAHGAGVRLKAANAVESNLL